MTETFYTVHPSPVGELLLTSDGDTLTGVYMKPHYPTEMAAVPFRTVPTAAPGGDPSIAESNATAGAAEYENGPAAPPPGWRREDAPFGAVRKQLDAYFAGERVTFEELPLRPAGTAFQRTVWRKLRTIQYGETATYGDIARAIGKPKAVRAVGAANGRNPIPIIVPCHRVIGSDGSLTGYGGGMERKRLLLDLEAGASRLL